MLAQSIEKRLAALQQKQEKAEKEKGERK